MSGFNSGYGGNYGYNPQNTLGRNQPNYGFQFGNLQATVQPNYGFSHQNYQSSAQNYGFTNQSQANWQTNFANHQNQQKNGGNYFSNDPPIGNDPSYDNYYGMATNESNNYNTDIDINQGTNFYETDDRPHQGNMNPANFQGGKKFKAPKRPLPDDPQEKRRIKRNNRTNKKRKMNMKPTPVVYSKAQLIDMAANKAPAGVEISKLSNKQLKQLVGVNKSPVSKVKNLSELKKNELMKLAAKHVNEKVNINSFTKRGLRAFLKKVDPMFQPAPGEDIPPQSKKCLSKWNAGEKVAAKLIEANKRAEEASMKEEDDTLANPVKVIETVNMRKVNFEKNRKPSKRFIPQKFSPSTIRSRYKEVAKNEVLDYNGLALVGFLRYALFDISPERRVHSTLLEGYVLNHPNVLKLLQYEVRKLLDDKFEGTANLAQGSKKRSLLASIKGETLRDDEHHFQDGRTSNRAWLIDGCIDILSADVYPADLIPTPADYIRDFANVPSHEDSIIEYQLLYFTYMYETLGFVIIDYLQQKNRVQFHLDNPILPALLVEFVRSYDTDVAYNKFHMFLVKPGDRVALPSAIQPFLMRKNNIGYCRSPELGKLYSELKANNLHVQTKVFDVMPDGAKPNTILLRNFSNFVLFSDEFFSLTKCKLIDHTPFLVLTREEKFDMFNALLKKTYREAYFIWENKLTIHDLTYKDVSGVPLNNVKSKIKG